MLRLTVLLALAAVSVLGQDKYPNEPGPLIGVRQRQKLRYHIENLYDGSPIDHPASPAVIEISLTCRGELKLDISAPFYYSPHPKEFQLHPECPNMPHPGLYNYEMIELHFLNDNDEYFDIRLSPHGQYMGFFRTLSVCPQGSCFEHKGQSNQLLSHVPEHHLTVEVHNPCLKPDGMSIVPDCHEPWSATTILSRTYLPPNVTKFNAHYLHGKTWGEMEPKPEDTVYESLYPQGSDAEKADFHVRGKFQPIDLSLLGYIELGRYSPLWMHAMGKIDLRDRTPIVHDSKCNYETTSAVYNVHVDLKRNSADKNVEVTVSVMDMESYKNVIPETLMAAGPTSKLGTKSESVWLNFQDAPGNYLRVGVNPKGAYNIMYVPGEGKLAKGEKKSEIKLGEKGAVCTEGKGPNWHCQFKIPFELLPPRNDEDNYQQILHFHKVKTEDGEVKTFTGAACPSFEDGKDFSWKGCSAEKRFYGPFDEPAADTGNVNALVFEATTW